VDRLAISAINQLLRGPCLAADPISRRVRLPSGAFHDDEAKQPAHPVAGIFAEHALARRQRVTRTYLQEGRRMIDASIEQGRIAHRKLERSDRDALAKADGHGFERTPARTRTQRMAALLELDRNRPKKAHLPQPVFLPLRSDLVGDLGGADVRAFLHDLGNRADASERVRIVDKVTIGWKYLRAVVLLTERPDYAAFHRHRDREWLESRAQLVNPLRCSVEASVGRRRSRRVRINLGQ